MKPETVFEELFFISVRIVAPQPLGGTSTGTGFVYHVHVGDDLITTFVMTNRHVLASAVDFSVEMFRVNHQGEPNLKDVQSIHFDVDTTTVIGHPNPQVDLVAIPMSMTLNSHEAARAPLMKLGFTSDDVPSESDLGQLDAVEDVRFVGYPNGLFDPANHLPLIRRGSVASFLQLDYDGQPVFLIDASVFPGSSGSPVFIVDKGPVADRRGSVVIGKPRLWLLGVLTSSLFHDALVVPSGTFPPVGATTVEFIDLGMVIKARTINECIDPWLEVQGVSRQSGPKPKVT